MKLFIFLIITFNTTLFSQENPWENKNTENPWGTESKQEVEKDSLVMVEKVDTVLSHESKKRLYKSAEADARANYKSGNDFAFGFTTGLFFNVLGTAPDAIYVIPTMKREKRAIEKVNNDPAYKYVDPEELNKKTKSAIKSKKFLASLGGTIVGSLVQFGVLIGLSATL